MQLYTIRFTTKKLIHKFDMKGKPIGTSELANPICMTALPHVTAMQYSKCDNFEIETYQLDAPKVSVSRKGVGNGTKSVDWTKVSSGMSGGKTKIAGASAKSKLATAAETGDLSAAVNG